MKRLQTPTHLIFVATSKGEVHRSRTQVVCKIRPSCLFLLRVSLSHSFLIVEIGITIRHEAAVRKYISPQHHVMHIVGMQTVVTTITLAIKSTYVQLVSEP